MPWTGPKPVPDEVDANENGDCKGDKCRNRTNGEEGAGGDWSAEDEEEHENTDNVIEPDGVDRGSSMPIHALDPRRGWETVVAGIGICDPGCSNLRGGVELWLISRGGKIERLTMHP